MTEADNPNPQSTVESAGTDGRQVTCIRCGYDLRNLDPAGNCPECGTAIEESLHGDLLRYADPDWRRTIMRGLRFVAWGTTLLAVILAALLIGGVVMAVMSLIPGLRGFGIVAVIATVIGSIISPSILSSCILLAVGIWFVTASEPRESAGFTPARARVLARWSILGLVLAVGYAAAVRLVPVLAASTTAIGVRSGLIGLALAMVMLSVMAHVMHLARRAEAHDLVKRGAKLFKSLRWLLPLAAVLMAMNAAISLAARGAAAAANPALTLQDAISCASSLIMLFAIADSIRALLWGGKAYQAIKSHLDDADAR